MSMMGQWYGCGVDKNEPSYQACAGSAYFISTGVGTEARVEVQKVDMQEVMVLYERGGVV